MATKGKKVELYYTSQGTTAGIDASALVFDGANLQILTHGKTFKGTDTDTKVTSVGNHYTPSANNDVSLNSTASSTGDYTINTEYSVVKAINIQRDAKGHVTGITTTNQKIKDTNTWQLASSSQVGYVPQATKGKYLHSNAESGALEWVDDRYAANTWRAVKVNGTEKLGSATSTNPLDVSAGANVSLSFTDNKLVIAATDTTYSFKNLTFQNNAGEAVDTYKPASAAKTLKAGTNVQMSAASSVITISATDTTYSAFVKSGANAAAGLVPKPSTTAGTTKFLREDGGWEVPSYTSIPSNNVTGSGTNGYIAKWNGTNTITNGPAFGTGNTFLKNDGTWATPTNTWTAADLNNAGYVPKSVKNYFLHANASSGALEWVANPDTNTHRPIQLKGTEILGNNTTALNFAQGTGITLTNNGGTITITNASPDVNHNTDKNVLQTDNNGDAARPVLMKNGTGTGDVTGAVLTCDGVTINPSSNSLSVSGNLSVTGTASFGNNVTLPNNKGIIQNQSSTSNYTCPITWYKGGTSQGTYNPQIGQHNTGGDGTGSICILPYTTETSPWGSTVGLFIQKGSAKLDNNTLIHSGNIGSQSVNYSTSSGNADTVGSFHETSFFRIRDGVSSNSNADNINQLGGFLNATGNGSGNSNYPETYSDFFDFPIYYHTQFSCRSNFYWRTLLSNPAGTAWRTLIDSYNYSSYCASASHTHTWASMTSKPSATGGATTPVYWNGSGFTNCTAYGSASVNYASSAGNADTLDNYHESSFWRNVSIRSDQNDPRTNLGNRFGGFDKGDYNGTYKDQYPMSYGHYMSVIPSDKNSAWMIHISSPAWSTDLGRIMVRTRGAGDVTEWSSWGTVAYTSDIPSTISWSNVTGKPSSFTPSSHTHDYLPLSGGTITNTNTETPLSIKGKGGYSTIQFISNNGDYRTFGIKANGDLFVTNNKGWSNEYPIYHAGNNNIGTGATNYAAGNHTHNYLPLSGGTMTGNITMGTNGIVYNQSTTTSWNCDAGSGIKLLNTVGASATGAPGSYHIGLSVSGYYGFQLAAYGGGGRLLYRNTCRGTYSTWSEIAYLSDLNSYLPLSGGTITGNITCGGENSFSAYMPRKKSGGGGWAYDPFTIRDAAGSVFFRIGVYGSDNTCSYGYIGYGSYNSSAHLRIDMSGNIIAGGSVYASSDRHIKSHIKSIARQSLGDFFEASDKLLKSYTLKNTRKESYGFIAQELEKYVPEAVNTDVNGVKSVSYDVAYAKLFAALIYKIKELEKKVESSNH